MEGVRGNTEVPSGLLDLWLREVVAGPGLTALRDLDDARRMLLDDSLRAVPLLSRFDGAIVDVGSGGGAPGIPLAVSLREREVTLLEAQERKCDFLRTWARQIPNVRVVQGRAEEQEVDAYGVAVAKALAPPPVAAEWCLPLVRPGGAAILFAGPSVDLDVLARVSAQLGGGDLEEHGGLVVLPKLVPTPPGFPRRTGIARKRPLG